METKQVEIGKSIRYGWAEVKKNFWYFIGLAIIVAVIEGITSGPRENRISYNLLGLFLAAWMTCGYTKILLDYHGGTKRQISDVFTQFTYFWRVLGANILLGIMIGLGMILLIVPGIYLALRFMFTIPLIIDKNLDIGEAMKQSTEMTRGIKMSLLGFALVSLGVFILGAIALGVGIFVAIPVIWLAYIYQYKALLSVQPTPPPPPAPAN